MTIDWLRDLVICICGLVIVGVLIFFAVLLYSLYHRTRSILDSVKATSRNIESISSYVRGEVARPLIEVAAIIQGVRQGIDAVTKLFRKEKGGGDV